jgi:hypothetical protein
MYIYNVYLFHYIAPLQLGVGVPWGSQCVGHALRSGLLCCPGDVTLQLDFRNAFLDFRNAAVEAFRLLISATAPIGLTPSLPECAAYARFAATSLAVASDLGDGQ